MCDRCADLDYAVADCWRPCYVPRPKPPGYIPTTPRGGFSDEDYDMQAKVDGLISTIRRQGETIRTLKAKQEPARDARNSFEGVE